MRLQQQFHARGDDGQGYDVDVWVDQIDATTLDERQGRVFIDGLRELRTSSGMAINRLAKGRYQIVQTGVILESSEPDAP